MIPEHDREPCTPNMFYPCRDDIFQGSYDAVEAGE